MPFYRSLPFKRGFTNIRRIEFAEVNLDRLGEFAAGTEVNPAVLAEAGLVRGGDERPVALLGRGTVKQALTIKVHRASKSAVAKVEAAGGKVEILERTAYTRRYGGGVNETLGLALFVDRAAISATGC